VRLNGGNCNKELREKTRDFLSLNHMRLAAK
jgi:hypothetical protein